MKYLAIILILCSSCSKEWNCTIVTETEYLGNTYTSTTETTIHGTTQEKEDFENSATQNQTITCQ